MNAIESIILGAAVRRSKLRNISELAAQSGTPKSTMSDKMQHPGKIRMSDLAAWDMWCDFTPDELRQMVALCSGGCR